MLLELIKTAHAARVLSALDAAGGKSRFTPLREAAGIGDQQLTRALRFLNSRGFISGRLLPEGERAPMEYRVTRLGKEALEILEAWHGLVHEMPGAAARAADQELESIVHA